MNISAKVQVTKKETVHPRLLLILVSSDEVMLSWRGSELATESLTFTRVDGVSWCSDACSRRRGGGLTGCTEVRMTGLG